MARCVSTWNKRRGDTRPCLDHRLNRETLYKPWTTYAGGLIDKLRAEQDRARQTSDPRRVSEPKIQIEDVEEFRSRIERGDELKTASAAAGRMRKQPARLARMLATSTMA